MTSTPEGTGSPWTQPSQPQDAGGYGTGAGWGPAHAAPGYGAPVQGAQPGPTTAPPGPVAPSSPAAPYAQAAPPAGYATMQAALRPGVVPLRPLTVGEVLDGAFRAVRANPGVMFGLTAVVVTVTVVVQAVLQWYVQGLLAGAFANAFTGFGELDEYFASTLSSSTAQFLTTTPTLGVAIAVLTGLLIVSVSRSVIGQRASAGEVWAKVRPHALALVGFSLLLNLVFVLVTALIVGLVVVFAAADQIGLVVLTVVVGLAALTVLSVWLVVRTILVPAVLVLEDQSLWRGIVRGWRLTRGSFWRLFGVLALAVIIVVVVASVVAVPGAFATTLLFPMANPTELGPLVVTSVVTVIAETLSTVFLAAVIALQYIDVRMRREGLDVALARAAADAS
ncbi:MAG: hypothetical protein GX593_01330 [Actinomycetales bacterium]|nr:hypothetical protein [Actinomycetales bacterium]